jgi:hypothetical protein
MNGLPSEEGEAMRIIRVLKMLAFVAIASAVFGFAIKYLWNWLMPGIFGLPTITYWQAVGLFVLSKILLGGFHRNGAGRGRHRGWKRHMEKRFAKMTPEDREKFRAGMRGRGCHWGREEKDRFREEVRSRWGRGPHEKSVVDVDVKEGL